MRKLTMVVVAGCMSAFVAGAYAAQGSPADTDKAGRMGSGTAAGQMGATDPTPGKAGGTSTKGGSSSSGASTSGGMSGSSSGGMSGSSSATSSDMSGSSSATAGSGSDGSKGKGRSRRARASKG